MSKRLFFTTIALLAMAICSAPVVAMVYKSLAVGGHFSLVAYRGILSGPAQRQAFINSFILATSVTMLTTGLGVPLGIILEKSDLPLRRIFTAIFIIPLLVPAFIYAVGWNDLIGCIDTLLPAGAAATVRQTLFGLPGAILVLSTAFLAIPLILTMVFLRTVNPAYEEAALTTTGWRGTLRGISLPLILPGVILAGILVFLLTIGELSVPLFLRCKVFPTESFVQFSAFYNFPAATAAAVPLAAVALALLGGERIFLRGRTALPRPQSRPDHLPPITLGRWRGIILLAIALLAASLIALPLASLALHSWGNYSAALQAAGMSLVWSLMYAGGGAVLLAFAGFIYGYIIQKQALPLWQTMDSLMIFLFVLPGTVIGIGLISLWNHPATNFVYTTSLIIFLGVTAKYMALSSRITAVYLARIPPSLEEAAAVAGAGWLQRQTGIMIPLVRRGILVSGITGYIFVLRDTDITMLVYPAGHAPLAVRIFTLMANGSPDTIAALCMIILALALFPAGLIWFIIEKTTAKDIA